MIRTKLTALIWSISLFVLSGCGGGGSGSTSPSGNSAPPSAPTITTQPASVSVADGAIATFTVVASGRTPLSFQWRRDGVDLTDDASTSGSTSPTLSLTAAYGSDGSQLSVRVSNASGSVTSNAAKLTVTPIAPTITAQPTDTTVASGTPATFSVTVSGGTAPISYQWRRDGSVIASATTSTYSFNPLITDSAATFSVDIVNPAGTITSSTASLTVTPPPKSWGPATQVNVGDANSDAQHPDVGIDMDGNAIAVWQQVVTDRSRYTVAASRYQAGVWGAPKSIDLAVGNAVNPQIVMTPNGEALAGFLQSTSNGGSILNFVTNRFDATWRTPTTLVVLPDVEALDPDIALTPYGTATAVLSEPDGAMGNRIWASSSATPGTWSTPVFLDGGYAQWPQVAVAANGHAIAIWAEQDPGSASGKTIWARRYIGGSWQFPVQLVTDTGALQSKIRLAIDAQGNAIAVWSQAVSSRNIVRTQRFDDRAGVWGSPVTMSEVSRDGMTPQIAMNNSGDAVVVWYEADLHTTGASLGIKSNRFDAAAGKWVGAQSVQSASATPGVDPIVGIDDTGNAVAAWVQSPAGGGSRQTLASATFTARDGTWAEPINMLTDDNAYTQGTEPVKIAVNGSGQAVLVWYQRTDSPRTAGIWARAYR